MNKEEFINSLKELNIILNNEQINSFETYKELLQEYNKKFNLTSITKDEDIYLKHFYDSVCIMKIKEIENSTNLLDIGTGAGFPGIPLAITNPNLKITLVESNGKKCGFLELVKEKLKLNNIEIINSRAEEYSKINREKFDTVTSRAVSHLSIITELEVPALKVNGYFIPLKANYEQELEESKNKMNLLGLTLENIIEYTLPKENSKRTILKIKKTKETSENYPREYNKILKEIKR